MEQNSAGEQPPVNPEKAFSTQLPPPTGGVPPIPPGRFGSQGAPPPGQNRPSGGWSPTPAPMPMMYPPSPPRHSFVRGILVTLATTIFGFSLMLNLYLLFISGVVSGGGQSRTETVLEGDPSQRVAIVPLTGVLTDDEYERFDRLLKRAEQDGVKGLIVEIDTPGGSVSASDMIYNRLLRFREQNPSVPVTAAMKSLATSGGYYAACGASHIVAQRSTMTGNIGVLMPRYNLSELAKKIGVADATIESTGTPYKNAGSMLKPENPEETKYFREIIDDAFSQFKQVVEVGRAGKLARPISEVANGKVYTAQQALKLGLIDQIGYLEDAIEQVAEAAGLSQPEAVRYREIPSLSDVLLGMNSKGVPQRGVTLEITPEMIDRLATPRLMYLWRGE